MRRIVDSYLKAIMLWIAACVIAIGLVEYQPLVGLAFALLGGIALGLLTSRGARA